MRTLIILTALGWGLLAYMNIGVLQGLYQRGYGSVEDAAILVGGPAFMLIISIAAPIWLKARRHKGAGIAIAVGSLVIWTGCFLFAALLTIP